MAGDQASQPQGVNALPTLLDAYRMLRAPQLSVTSTGESETFRDWLAFKVQNPCKRIFAAVLVAENAFGIGQSLEGNILERALQGRCQRHTSNNQLSAGRPPIRPPTIKLGVSVSFCR